MTEHITKAHCLNALSNTSAGLQWEDGLVLHWAPCPLSLSLPFWPIWSVVCLCNLLIANQTLWSDQSPDTRYLQLFPTILVQFNDNLTAIGVLLTCTCRDSYAILRNRAKTLPYYFSSSAIFMKTPKKVWNHCKSAKPTEI